MSGQRTSGHLNPDGDDRAAEALRQSEESLRIAQHLAHIGDWRWTVATDTVKWSEELFHINGRDPKLPAPPFAEMSACYTPESWKRLSDAVATALQLGASYELELEIVRPDGATRLTLARGEVDRDAGGRITGMHGTVQDITERKMAEAALRESEDKFKYFFEYSTIGQSVTLPSGETRVNNAFCRMMGYPPEELRGTRWQDITHPDDIELTQREIDSLLSGEKSAARFNKRFLKKDGSELWIDLSSSLRRDAAGKPLYLMTALVDITERKRAEEEILRLNAELEQRVGERTAELETANREMEAFCYSISHDLRSPLRGIDGWSLAILEDCGARLDDQARTFLDRVRAEAQHMGELIDDQLDLSRLTRTEMHATRVDLSAVARKIAAHLQETTPERPVEFVIQPGVNASGDAHLSEILLTNLLGNAHKFTGKTPRARIEFGQTRIDGQRVFFVRDNGAGFDPAHAGRLFGAFQRMHKTSEFPGTGIGLTIVQRIVHRHGGRIWAEAAVNRGATFSFTLAERP